MRALILAIIMVVSMGCADRSWSSGEPDYSKKYDPTRDAFADLDDAREKAKKENKNILIIVGGEWCRWCHALDEYISSNREVRGALLEKYVVLKIGINQSGEITPLLDTLPEFVGTPHFYFMSSSGRLRRAVSSTAIETNDSYDQRKFIDLLIENAS